MIALLLIVSIIAQVAQQVCRKEYSKKTSGTPICFSVIGVFSTLVYFLIMSKGRINVTLDMLPYILLFAANYTCAYIMTNFAIKHGPLSLTSLIISCSVVVPLIYGITFLSEPVTVVPLIGFILLFASITFVSEPWKKEDTVITFKWVLYVGLAFLCNGICVTVQKLFQIKDMGVHSNEFMICSLLITFLVIFIFALIREIKELKNIFKKERVIWPLLCGGGNGVANQLTMILAVSLPASFLYPVQSAGGIILTAAVSMLFYKEKMSVCQKIGFVLGVVAIVMFNI